MSQFPPDRDRAPGGGPTDWHALLTGDQPAAPQNADAATQGDVQTASDRPLTRREIREREARAQQAGSQPPEPVPAPAQRDAGRDGADRYAAPRERTADPFPVGGDGRPDVAEPDWWTSRSDDDVDGTATGRLSRTERRAATSEDRGDRPRRTGAWGCLIALVVLVALGAAGFFALQGPVNDLLARFEPAADYDGSGTGEVVFMINEGDGGETIAANLAEQDVVASSEAFTERLLAETPEPTFFPGAYRLASKMSADAALTALLDPANKLENTFVIQEGLWARDAFAAAAAATQIPVEELQAVAANPQALGLPPEATSIEGFLFPATYTFAPGVTAQEVVQTLVNRTFESLDAAGVAPEDRFRVITIASLIEREAGSQADAYKVSRVIQNRLDPAKFDSGLLQFDSAVHYGLQEDTVVTTTDAERADTTNLYNTYVYPGLPPGPIGNPGDIAIDAAQNPEPGEWLYFVTVNLDTGETVFSTTLGEHETAVQRFLEFLDANPQYGG